MKPKGVSLAKTARPSFAGILPRDRLFARLDAARANRAIWVTGPPGAGKTSLIASYLERRKLRSLWYQLDESDTDAASFFYHLDLAVAEQPKGKAGKAPPLPRLTPEYQSGLPAFIKRYAEAVFQRLGKEFVVVFDGYHDVPAQSQFHELMRDGLEVVPPGGCVIIISRADPPPIMARLRVSQGMTVIGWDDVRLTREESDAIAASRGHVLPEEARSELYARTQGWTAGLILLLEHASGQDALDTPADFDTPQLVFDYLAGEIFQKADKHTRALLLSTAYLSHMTANMARELSGQEDAGTRLAEMHRNNYFVMLMRASPPAIYQIHPLMHEFLLTQARETLPAEQRTALQRRSAELLESEGQLVEAAALLRETEDWIALVGLIERHGEEMANRAMGLTLRRWVEALPRSVLERHPWVTYWLAASVTPVSPREGRIMYEQAFELFSRQAQPDVRGLALAASGAMDAILYELDDFSLLDRWIGLLERLLREHPDITTGAVEARLTSSLFTSMVMRQPHHADLEHWVERAYRASREQPDAGVRMSVEPRVAISILWAGHYPKTREVIDGMRPLVATADVSAFARTMLKLVEAMYCMHTSNLEGCLAAVREGREIERAAGAHVHTGQLLAYAAGGALMVGELDIAGSYLAELAELPGDKPRFDQCLYYLFSTWHALASGDKLAAYRHQYRALRVAIEVGSPYFEALCRLASGQVLFESGEERNAMSHFQRLYEIAREIDNPLLEFTGLIGFACTIPERGGRPRTGSWAMRRALEIGMPRGFTAFILWRPEPLARLCSQALEAGIDPRYVAEIIRARSLKLDAVRHPLAEWPWPLRIHTLGRFRLEKGDREIVFTGKGHRKPLELLKALVASGGRQVSDANLAEAVWPRVEGDSAHRSFTTNLHRLRKLLGEDRVLPLAEGKLSLDGNYVWVDTWAFEQATSQLEQMLRDPHGRATPERLAALGDRVLALYSGPFLAHEPDAPWSLAMRDRLRARFVRSVGALCRQWERIGEAERAVAHYERALEVDDLAESFYRGLMQCHAARGRRAEAVEVYSRCRKTLAARLAVEPSPETRAIYERLVAAR
ncbi:MAG: winged helix-turn-helix domain-containing protein [Betaproteobacteria bacterium]|nr:winged helix-turn-helix domain-containing protein [Betaproteobacteria bacterium]